MAVIGYRTRSPMFLSTGIIIIITCLPFFLKVKSLPFPDRMFLEKSNVENTSFFSGILIFWTFTYLNMIIEKCKFSIVAKSVL